MKLRCLSKAGHWKVYLLNEMGDRALNEKKIDIHGKSKFVICANKVIDSKWSSNILAEKVSKNWF